MAGVDRFAFRKRGCASIAETNCRKCEIRNGLWSDIRFRIRFRISSASKVGRLSMPRAAKRRFNAAERLSTEKKKGQARLILTFGWFVPMLSIMPRAPRASVGGICYHVMNRGNGRRAVFHKDGDYQAFLKAIGQRQKRGQARLLLTFNRFAAMLSSTPRAPRAFVGGIYYRVKNRGN